MARCEYSCAYLLPIAHTRLRVHRAPGIPHALCFQGGRFIANLGRIAPRDREGVSVIASAEQPHTQSSSPAKAGDPVLRDASDESISRGVLDTPLSRSMTTSWGRAKQSNPLFLFAALWIASRSLSSGAYSRDPLALPIPNFFLKSRLLKVATFCTVGCGRCVFQVAGNRMLTKHRSCCRIPKFRAH